MRNGDPIHHAGRAEAGPDEADLFMSTFDVLLV